MINKKKKVAASYVIFHSLWQGISSSTCTSTITAERDYLWIFQWNTAWGIFSVIFSVEKETGKSGPTACGICKDKSIMSAFSRTFISPLIGHMGKMLSKLLWWTGLYRSDKDNAFYISLIVRKMNHNTCQWITSKCGQMGKHICSKGCVQLLLEIPG